MTQVMQPSGDSAVESPTQGSWPLTVLFTAAAFSGAALLFVVQPMVARLLLPSYGGSATVWSTASLFFQVLLLVGYVYAHASIRRLGAWQPRVHLLVLAVPALLLPVALPANAAPAADSSPALWLLRTLTVMIALPFLVVSTTGPLLQKWYSWTESRRADDPYFLFAASNLGSFGGLLAYPFLIEPTLSLEQQQRWWSIGFAGYAVLTGLCCVAGWRLRRPDIEATAVPAAAATSLPATRLLRWLGWAFLPSALMLAVTSHISTDVAAIPLLWVIPLAIYLATFVVAFGRTTRRLPVAATRVAVAFALVAAISPALPALGASVIAEIALGIAVIAAVSFAAHARLAVDRPEPEHLTTFYIVVAVGGALGGVLNGLVAPIVFDRVLEYPLVMVCVPLLMLGLPRTTTWLDRMATRRVLWPAILLGLAGLATVGIVGRVQSGTEVPWFSWLALLAVVAILAYRFAQTAPVMAAVLMCAFGIPLVAQGSQDLEQSRTFFGSYRVLERGGRNVLVHGRTVHGSQFTDDRSGSPTTYYARTGPLGGVFADAEDMREVGVVGLGVGTVAAYGLPGMRMTFFEIDGEVVRIAASTERFTYLADSAATIKTVVGDGRLKVAGQPEGTFDALLLDAFSSDAIPIHLLTVEAMRMYASRLANDGILVVHISNKVFDLEPVLAGATQDLAWSAAVGYGGSGEGAQVSKWVALSPSSQRIEHLVALDDWTSLDASPVTWTDDFSSILDVIR